MSDVEKAIAAAIAATLLALGAGVALSSKEDAKALAPAKEVTLEVDVAKKDLDPAPEVKRTVREYSTIEGRIFGYESGGKLVQAPPQCVIPACADDVGPVNCLCNGRWAGCNTCPKEAATGDECLPSSCVLDNGEVAK